MSGRLHDALIEFEEGISISRALALSSSTVAWLQYNYADVLFRLGRLDEVRTLLPQVPVAVSGGAIVLGGIVTANLALVRGDFDDVIAFGADPGVTFDEDLECASSVAAVHAEALLWKGDVDSAVSLVREALEEVAGGDEIFETARLVMVAMRVFADATRRERMLHPDEQSARFDADVRAARCEMGRLFGASTPRGGRVIFPQVAACRASLEAEWTRLAGRSDVRAWESALALWDDLGHEIDAAYVCFRLAEACASTGRRADVAAPLRRAASLAEKLGAGPLSREVSALARRVRIPVSGAVATRPLRRSQSHTLTAREVQVLRCLAQGMTDREIAERLTISTKTAGTHVANIRRKLHAESRVEAAAYANELDPPAPV